MPKKNPTPQSEGAKTVPLSDALSASERTPVTPLSMQPTPEQSRRARAFFAGYLAQKYPGTKWTPTRRAEVQ